MSDYIAIKDFEHKEAYTTLVAKKIFGYFRAMLFDPIFKELRLKRAINSVDVVIDALRSGRLVYVNGEFKAIGKFTNNISKELVRLGAVWNKYNHSYVLPIESMPKKLVDEINTILRWHKERLEFVNELLNDLQMNLDHWVDVMAFDEEIKTIVLDSGEQIKKTVRKINVIEPELSEEQLDEIAAAYTNNMRLSIKRRMSGRIEEMRQQVQRAILEGYREDYVAKMMEKEYGIAARDAKFLAQNETSLVLAQYKKVVYKEMGFEEFVWQTITDGKERELHKQLNGKIFRFDEPPIIDERTGQRGLPGETYNCRCSLVPIRRNSVFVGEQQWRQGKDLTGYKQYLQDFNNRRKVAKK